MEILLLAVTASVILSYYDKKGVISGLSKLQYIFLKMIALIPFCVILFLIYPFKFEINYVSILLILGVLIVNATNYLGFIGVVKKTTPYETGVLLTATVPIIYLIDVLIGTETFSYIAILFLLLIIVGVVVMTTKEIKLIEFRGSLLLSIVSSIAKGYLLHFLLRYLSIPVYLLVIHILTALFIIVFLNKKLEIKQLTKQNFKWAFTTQFIGTFSLVFNAILAKTSVSLYVLRTPFQLIILTISSYFIKNEEYGEKPSVKRVKTNKNNSCNCTQIKFL